MTNEELMGLDTKLACGPNGAPVTITGVDVGDSNKEGHIRIEISGEATDYLLNPQNANAGSEPLPSKLFVSEGFDIEEKDKTKLFAKWNKIFNIHPPLVDCDEEILRFGEGAEDSVVDQIVGKGAYFKLNVKPPSNPKFAPTVYSNTWAVPVKNPATVDTIQAALDKIAAKKAAKKVEEDKKAKELEDAFN